MSTSLVIKALIARHPEHQCWADHWYFLDLLSKGGYRVNKEVKAKMLANPTSRPASMIEKRAKVSVYEPLIGTITAKITSQLMREQANYIGSDDDFWSDFFRRGFIDNRGQRTSFHAFLTKCVDNANGQGLGIGHVDANPGTGGRLNPYLMVRDNWDLWDWCKSGDRVDFLKFHSYYEEKKLWYEPVDRYHEFLIYQTEENGKVTASKYQVRIKDDNGTLSFTEQDLALIREDKLLVTPILEEVEIFHLTSGKNKFPVSFLEFPPQLQIADQLYDLQLGLFNNDASGRWALASTNFAELVVTGIDRQGEEFNDNPLRWSQTGDGHWLELKPGMDIRWLTRDTAGIQLAFEARDADKKAMLEKIHSISQVAVNAYRQSGESKKEDRRSMDILLEVYGQRIREFAKDILTTAAIAHGEDIDWIVEGFSDYDSEGLTEELEQYLLLEKSNIPSQTLLKEMQKAIAVKAVQELGLEDEKVEKIVEEITESDPVTHADKDELNIVADAHATGALSAAEYRQYLIDSGIVKLRSTEITTENMTEEDDDGAKEDEGDDQD